MKAIEQALQDKVELKARNKGVIKMNKEQQDLINHVVKQIQSEVLAANGRVRLAFVVEEGCKRLVEVVNMINEVSSNEH